MVEKKPAVIISGIGWITQEKYGSVGTRLSQNYSKNISLHSQLLDKGIFLHPVKNFGRFDKISKETCSVVALAFQDAGVSYTENDNKDMGLIGTNTLGSLFTNMAYFKDYVENGRSLSRGNLFMYTLPTSPLAEAAINCGCQGPLLYIRFSCGPTCISSCGSIKTVSLPSDS